MGHLLHLAGPLLNWLRFIIVLLVLGAQNCSAAGVLQQWLPGGDLSLDLLALLLLIHPRTPLPFPFVDLDLELKGNLT